MKLDIGVPSNSGVNLDELYARSQGTPIEFIEVVLEAPAYRAGEETFPGPIMNPPDDLDVIVHLPFGGVDVGSPFDQVRSGAIAELKRGIDFAKEQDARKCVIHADTFVIPEIWPIDDIRSIIVQSIDELDRYAKQHGVEATVENVSCPFLSLEAFPVLFEETDVAITLDTGHARLIGMGDEEIASFVAEHSHRISHFHFNDTRGASDDHLPVGMGSTDFGAILSALPDDWEGTATVEAITEEFAYLEVGVELLRREIDR